MAEPSGAYRTTASSSIQMSSRMAELTDDAQTSTSISTQDRSRAVRSVAETCRTPGCRLSASWSVPASSSLAPAASIPDRNPQ